MASELRYDYLIVGAGVTSVWAAQNIRENDATATIAIVGEEEHPPYDRPPLSKGMLMRDDMPVDDPYSKFDEFYPKHDITLHKATRVVGVQPAERTVTLSDGATVGYGKLLLATGSRARQLALPGADCAGVYYLRSIADALKLRDAYQQAQNVVVIGGGFIGLEAAASARTRGLNVTILEQGERLWSNFASPALGDFLKDYFTQQGVTVALQEKVTAINGAEAVTGVTTESGKTYPADAVLIGVGAALNTELAQTAGLALGATGGVQVNEFLQTSDPNIWAAGDIADFNDLALERQWHAEHHLNAKWQGQAVGKIMAGGTDPYDRVPYFFSDMFDIHMILRGDPTGGETRLLLGDPAAAEFTELYCNAAGAVRMGIAISHEEPKLDAISDILEALIRAKTSLKGREAEIQTPGFDLASLV